LTESVGRHDSGVTAADDHNSGSGSHCCLLEAGAGDSASWTVKLRLAVSEA
jgi:hypothetical protein